METSQFNICFFIFLTNCPRHFPISSRDNCNANVYYCTRGGGGGNISPPGRRLRRSFREQHTPQDDSSGGFFSSLWRRKKTASSDFDFGAVGARAPCHDDRRVRRRTAEQNYGDVDRLPMVLQLQQMVPTTTAMTPHQHQRRFGQGEKWVSSDIFSKLLRADVSCS